MLKPDFTELLQDGGSCFSLVIAVAKRAREITDEVEEVKKGIMDTNNGKLPVDLGPGKNYLKEKPVKLAVEELANGKFKIVQKSNIGENIEM